jgi:hypothetical protein
MKLITILSDSKEPYFQIKIESKGEELPYKFLKEIYSRHLTHFFYNLYQEKVFDLLLNYDPEIIKEYFSNPNIKVKESQFLQDCLSLLNILIDTFTFDIIFTYIWLEFIEFDDWSLYLNTTDKINFYSIEDDVSLRVELILINYPLVDFKKALSFEPQIKLTISNFFTNYF